MELRLFLKELLWNTSVENLNGTIVLLHRTLIIKLAFRVDDKKTDRQRTHRSLSPKVFYYQYGITGMVTIVEFHSVPAAKIYRFL